MAIDQSIINFAVYEDSIEYAGMAKVTLPDVTFLTQSISGAGIGGNIDAVILGHLEAMTLGLEFRTTTAQSIKLSEIRRHQIDLRVPVQYEDPINGTNGNPKAGPAKITIIKQGALHPYHVIHTDGTSRVYGWVDASEISGKSGSGSSGSSSGSGEESLKIRATITACNWHSDGKDEALDCGTFELDSVVASGPPGIITIKAIGLPYTSQIRQTKQSKGWEKYKLSGIANEMASKNGMAAQFLAKKDPEYKRVEQYRCSDIDFLQQLCHDAGLSLKCTDGKIVIFDQQEYEGKDAVWTTTLGDKSYIKYSHSLGQAGTQYASCRVSYVGPDGKAIEGIAYVKDYDAKSKTNQQLEVYAPVTSKAEAKELAAKKLRLYNKFERQMSFTFPGDPGKVAGLTFNAEGFGPWSGKYIVKQSKHTVSGSGGYTTQVIGRHTLGGY